jgi:hypothetical protein
VRPLLGGFDAPEKNTISAASTARVCHSASSACGVGLGFPNDQSPPLPSLRWAAGRSAGMRGGGGGGCGCAGNRMDLSLWPAGGEGESRAGDAFNDALQVCEPG